MRRHYFRPKDAAFYAENIHNHNIGLQEFSIFSRRKLVKMDENSDRDIEPRPFLALSSISGSAYSRTFFLNCNASKTCNKGNKGQERAQQTHLNSQWP
jgi:hypothetical protein